jgi:LysR family transcriptional regulator, flagellar master operon regulator
MDTEFARTFLMVAAAGSFVGAAERLHVTQSTVSARVRALEEQLNATLFVRSRAGAVLTDAGRRFQKHAALLVRTAEQARHDAGLPSGIRASAVIGARIGLWEGLLVDRLAELGRCPTYRSGRKSASKPT